MSWTVVTRPTEPVPSLEEVKKHLRSADFTDDDDDILSKIWGAITEFEDPTLGWLGTSVLAREIELSLPCFPTAICLPCGPVLETDDYPLVVKYDDEDGVEQTLPGATYRVLDPETACLRIVLQSGQSWPATISGDASVRVTYWAGYDATDTRVNNFKSAVKFHVQMTYDGETEVDHNLPETIRRLLQPYRSMFV